ncbi:unnamed protein product [Oppiella nova]|uniref:Uncharacterized protein n=1 Tax=Oppiella nova TaxID=334625 RepID=A0A7R9M865_9ACAR|nr:unnamed protein product [Oppiella nova]CAG2172601.1 unnamed protein product [Oppiella nova]
MYLQVILKFIKRYRGSDIEPTATSSAAADLSASTSLISRTFRPFLSTSPFSPNTSSAMEGLRCAFEPTAMSSAAADLSASTSLINRTFRPFLSTSPLYSPVYYR